MTAHHPVNTASNWQPRWLRLRWFDRLVIALAIVVVGVVTVPRLPPGICYGDSGGLQLAAATGGITHPPGYSGYVSLGFLATLIPGVSPAYMVSLACLGAGLTTLLMCILMQVRIGVAPGLASAVTLALTIHPRVWANLLAPEVYMPSLAFVAGAAYLLVKYARLGRHRDLFVAALPFGIALANRPPVVLTLPFFLAAWWLSERRLKRFPVSGRVPPRSLPSDQEGERGVVRDPTVESVPATRGRHGFTSILIVTGLTLLPAAYSFGYLWVRDRPQTPFNYIQQYNDEFHELPDVQGGWQAKLTRVIWHATGRQFHDRWGSTWSGVRLRLNWLRNRLLPDRPLTFAIGLLVVLFGAVAAFRRCPICALLLTGLAMASIVFLCAYRVTDDAADILPLLFTVAVFGGAALSPLFSTQGGRRRRLAALAFVFVAAAAFTLFHAPRRYPVGRAVDARPYLLAVDLGTLPENALIYSSWATSCPLWYAQHVLGQRRDIQVINAMPGNWPQFIAPNDDHAIFTTSKPGRLEGYTVTPYRILWRVESATD